MYFLHHASCSYIIAIVIVTLLSCRRRFYCHGHTRRRRCISALVSFYAVHIIFSAAWTKLASHEPTYSISVIVVRQAYAASTEKKEVFMMQ
eukprot:5551609-Ditylum_brightwellii.AAC.1